MNSKNTELYLYAKNIEWDIDKYDVADAIIEKGLVKEAIGVSPEEIVKSANAPEYTIDEYDLVADKIVEAIENGSINEDVVDDVIVVPESEIKIPLSVFKDCSEEDYEYEYFDAISKYISDETGYCHKGYSIECDMSIEEIEAVLENPEGMSEEMVNGLKAAKKVMEYEMSFEEDIEKD